uniref:Uncharacterized protein n=1 Tax=viral metagenome TaxID=1070528 RepID=A0A6C0HYM0_9ZZZZ
MTEVGCNFDEIGLKIPELIYSYPSELQKRVFHYLSQLGENERKAYSIAQGHLGTSFNIVRSTGYVEWTKKNK